MIIKASKHRRNKGQSPRRPGCYTRIYQDDVFSVSMMRDTSPRCGRLLRRIKGGPLTVLIIAAQPRRHYLRQANRADCGVAPRTGIPPGHRGTRNGAGVTAVPGTPSKRSLIETLSGEEMEVLLQSIRTGWSEQVEDVLQSIRM